MSYGKKLNELDRQVDRFGIDEDFCRELYTLACKILEKYPVGNDELKDVLNRFQENERMFVVLMDACRCHLKNYTRISINNDNSISSDSHNSS